MTEIEPHSLEDIGHALRTALNKPPVEDQETGDLLSAIKQILLENIEPCDIVRADRRAKVTNPRRGFLNG